MDARLPYINKRKAVEVRKLARDVEAEALELEIRGLDLELDGLRSNHTQLVQVIGERETERSQLQIRLNDLRSMT